MWVACWDGNLAKRRYLLDVDDKEMSFKKCVTIAPALLLLHPSLNITSHMHCSFFLFLHVVQNSSLRNKVARFAV